MNELATRNCRPLEGHAPMGDAEIEQLLAQVEGWSLVDGAIQKRFEFEDFHRSVGFANAVAWVANTQDHHPDLALSYDKCTVRFSTHSVGGISINDFICAARVNALQR
ncbi:MAG: 4a-hydroxytetrahydrobiopterin dehydratase [Rubrivivax sp.]